MNFCSDNASSAHPRIVAALAEANEGPAMPYGADAITRRVEARLAALFEHEVAVVLVGTGTAANVLGLAAVTPPWGCIYCHPDSHINQDECAAPEFYTGGAKLIPVAGEHGKIDPAALAQTLDAGGAGVVHHAQPATLALTQATEAGTVYRPEEIAALTGIARAHGLAVQMDGARFANAVVSLGASPAALSWRAGVDVLSFGATKNGALAAEAILFFKPEQAETAGFRRKRGGQLWSKMRYLSAQMDAYLAEDLWRTNAAHANAMAARLAAGLAALPGTRLLHPVEANEIFTRLPEAAILALKAAGFAFYRWPGPEPSVVRLVTAFDTRSEHVDAFVATARAAG